MQDETKQIKVWHIATGDFDILTANIEDIKKRTPSALLEAKSILASGIKGTLVSIHDLDWIRSNEVGASITLLVDQIGYYKVATYVPQTQYIYLTQLKAKEKPQYDYSKAFIIMSMTQGNQELDDIRDAIGRGVEEAANDLNMPPILCSRVDDRRGEIYNIDEEIFRSLETSGLIICDLTEEKPNCYFELAWAMAHKRKIIVTAKVGTRIHFDVSRINIRFWGSMRDLRNTIKENAIAIYTEHRFGGKRPK